MLGETHQTIADILSRPLLFRYLSVSCNDNQLAQTEQGQCLFCDLKYVDIVGEPVLPAHGVHPDRSRRLVTGVHLTLLRHCLRPRPRPHPHVNLKIYGQLREYGQWQRRKNVNYNY